MASTGSLICATTISTSMSRRQPQPYVEAQAATGDFEEEEAVSGTAEGDEAMEDAQGEEEEGYSEH